jgi:glutamate racemase
VGVLATPATFQGELYASVVERFANGVELFQNTCTGLVQEIEQGNLNGSETRRILNDALLPMLEKNIDTVVLGCTHYPFVIPLIEEIVGGKVRVIDPAPAVARRVKRLLEAGGRKSPSSARGKIQLYTSAEVESLEPLLPVLLGESGEVKRVEWLDDSVIASFARNDMLQRPSQHHTEDRDDDAEMQKQVAVNQKTLQGNAKKRQ